MLPLELEAFIYDKKIGSFVIHNDIVYFEYDKNFGTSGLEISPLKLHTQKITALYSNKDSDYFQGLAGVFFDSLPDAFGMSFIDRYFEYREYNAKDITILHKLSFIGSDGMGAIEYRPKIITQDKMIDKVLNAKQTHNRLKDILSHQTNIKAKELMQIVYGASPIGGGRPKMLVCYNPTTNELKTNAPTLQSGFKRAIIKFDEVYYNDESIELTKLEYIYMQMAKECGINIPKIYLYQEDGLSHLVVERFDRDEMDNKYHIITACALLHKDIRVPQVASYEELFTLTNYICKTHSSVIELYRRMVFNLLSYNVDDHMKNFSFMMDREGLWDLAPAYDITYSYGVVKNHLTTLKGKSSDFTEDDFLYIAKKNLIKPKKAKEIVKQVTQVLSSFEHRANSINLSSETTNEVVEKLNTGENYGIKN